ncbi:MAG TPA: hypothetical protein VD771_08245, partial [Gemmatimonadaceae bacterium]|nr:hypothetical protein [Gemmatimonadaceae bacterium]
ALAARDAALDREGLAASEKSALAQAPDNPSSKSRFVRSTREDATDPVDRGSYDPSDNLKPRSREEATPSYTIDLPTSKSMAPSPVAMTPRAIPDVRGLSVREAVRALHGAGFRVRLATAPAPGTLPAAGTMAAPGSLVQLNRRVE